MKKRIISLFLTLTMVASFIPSVLADNDTDNTIPATSVEHESVIVSDGDLFVEATPEATAISEENSEMAPASNATVTEEPLPVERELSESNIMNISENLTYECLTYTVSDNTVTITDCDESAVRVNIPTTINDMPVVAIGASAFSDCKSLMEITIPKGVASIGYRAFMSCGSLTDIIIPEGVGNIGEYTFYGCIALKTITLPKSLISISMTNNATFSDCDVLTDVYYGGNETQWNAVIGHEIFDGNSFNYINIHCNTNTTYGEVLDKTIGGNCGDKAKWSLNTKTGILNITGNGDMTSYAFSIAPWYNYRGFITEINVAAGITSISGFCECGALERVSIPNTVLTIEDNTFGDCGGLEYITIPSGVASIGKYTFYNCKSLMEITIPKGVASIGYRAFMSCGSLTDIIIPEGVGNIGEYTFYGCIALKTITLPKSLISISMTNNATFSGCDALTDVYYGGNETQWNAVIGHEVFEGDISYVVIHFNAITDISGFDPDIYRANYLITSDLGKRMEEKYIGMETPSQKVYQAGQENGMGISTDAWNAVMDTLNALDRPSSIADYAFEEKDMYEAIIMNLFESSVDYKFMDYINNNITKQATNLSSTVTSTMKSLYNLDVIDPAAVSQMSDEELEIFEKELGEAFKEVHGVATATADITKIINTGIKYGKSIESLCETIEMYKNIRDLSDSMKQIMRMMYDECPSDNPALKTALFECIATMNTGEKTFTTEMTTYAAFAIGKNVAQYGIDKLWSSVKSTFSISHPAAFAFQAAYTAGKYVTQICFNADAIQENYCKVIAMIKTEDLLMSIYDEVKSNFQNSPTSESAKVYNSTVDIMFNMLDTDCAYADGFIGAVDGNLMSSLLDLFGDDTAENLQKQIKNIQDGYWQFHEQTKTFWVHQLEKENPMLFNEYSHLIDESNARLIKKYAVSCPVDVYIYDNNGVLVGSVVNNIPHCRSNANITIAVDGEKKMIYMYGNDEYKISYIGNDMGEMDISIAEYDNDNKVTRNVYFNNINLTDGMKYDAVDSGLNSGFDTYVLTDVNDEIITPGYDTLNNTDEVVYLASVERGYFTELTAVSRELHAGENAEIAAYVPSGYKFIGWTTDTGEDVFADATSITTSICMPDHTIHITANIEKCPTISITDFSDNSVIVDTLNCDDIQGEIILAVYDTNDMLKSIYTKPLAESVIFENLDLTNVKIKVMLWNSIDKMTPMAKATELVTG